MAKYLEYTKEQLVEEIKKRNANGSSISVDLRANKETLVKALEMDDVESGETKPPAETPHPLANQIPLQPEMPTAATQPHADVFAKGFQARSNVDGYTYEVAVVADDSLKPYKARVPKQSSGHPGMFWEGSEVEFKEAFAKL